MKLVLTSDIHYGHSARADRAVEYMFRDIKEINPDLLVIAGDYSSSSEEDRYKCWKMIRGILENIRIGAIGGNHDEWDSEEVLSSVEEINENNLKFMKEFSITHLHETIEMKGLRSQVTITGYDGWYHIDPSTNDKYYIPQYLPYGLHWLQEKADREFRECITTLKEAKAKEHTTVLVTHFGFIKEESYNGYKNSVHGSFARALEPEYFGANPRYEEFIGDVDLLLVGHTHAEYDALASNGITRVINCGSDYGYPLFRVLEI